MPNITVTSDINALLDADNLATSKQALATLGAVVTGGALGTPAAGSVLTNATGLPIVAGTSGTLTVERGGTNATTASTARANILPAYATNAGKVLAVNSGATDVEYISASGTGSVTSVALAGGTTGLTTSGGPITAAGTITLAGTLNVANGGTGTASPAIVAGNNVTVSGTWPNQIINALGSPISGTNNAFIFDGDSISTDNAGGAGLGWPVQLMASPTFSGKGTKYNFATSSSVVSGMVTRYGESVLALRPALNSGRPAYLFVLCGTNDMRTTTAATLISDLESYWTTAKADGFTVVAMTVMPANFDVLDEVKRQAVNNGIRRSNTWDYLIDASSVLPNKYDTNVYGDGLHPTAAGNRIIAREAEAVFITRRKAPMPDTTATRAAARLALGGSTSNTTQTLVVVDEQVGGAASTSGNSISSTVTSTADVGFSHTSLSVGVNQLGSFGVQYLYGTNSAVVLANAKNISEGAAFKSYLSTNSGSGIMYSGVSFLAARPFPVGGVIERATGLKVELQKQSLVTVGVGIDVVGATDVNFIVGKLRLGSTVTPTRALDVTGEFGVTTGSITTETIGKTVGIKSGANSLSGTFTANGVTPVVVATTAWDANCVAIITLKTIGGTVTTQPFVSSVTAGTGFSVTSAAGDTSTYNWVALKVN